MMKQITNMLGEDLLGHYVRKQQYVVEIENIQSLLKCLRQFHDSSYVQECSQWMIRMQTSIENSQHSRNKITNLQQELQSIYLSQTSLLSAKSQLDLQLTHIDQEKIQFCSKLIGQLEQYANKFSFQNIVIDFIHEYSRNRKQAVNNLLEFTSNYKSMSIHRVVESKLQQIDKQYNKINILFTPRVQSIKKSKQELQNNIQQLKSYRQQLEKDILSLRIDQQIQKNQYRRALAAHQEKLNQSENYIKMQAKNITLQYTHYEVIEQNYSQSDFQSLLFQQFMKRVNIYTQYLQNLQNLKQKLHINEQQITVLKSNCCVFSHYQSQYNKLSVSETVDRQSQENQNKNSKIMNRDNIKKSNVKNNQNYYEIYKKVSIGNNLKSQNNQHYGNHNFRIMYLEKNKVVFKKDHRIEKIQLIKIQKLQVTKSYEAIIHMKKGSILIYFPNKDAKLFLIQFQSHIALEESN